MSAARLAKIDHVVMRGIQAGGYPGAAVVVGRKGAAVWQRGFGRLDWSEESSTVDPTESVYDLASLTKVVGTTTALMILFDEGKVHLDDPVSKYIPEFSGGEKDLVTLRLLLEHRSGLPAGRDLWRVGHTPDEARQAGIDRSASDLAVLPHKLLNGGQGSGTRRNADQTVAPLACRAARTVALGWDTCAGDGRCGKYLSGRAHCDTGFSGTSVWRDS